MMIINYYEILGVRPDADLVQITAAWRRLLKKYHPDLNQDDLNANEQTILLNRAFEVLSDPNKRLRFDKQLADLDQAKEQSFDQAADWRNFAMPSVFGVMMGGVSAILIGLFLTWTISGYDPLQIFRQESLQTVSREEDLDPADTAQNQITQLAANTKKNAANPTEHLVGSNEVVQAKKIAHAKNGIVIRPSSIEVIPDTISGAKSEDRQAVLTTGQPSIGGPLTQSGLVAAHSTEQTVEQDEAAPALPFSLNDKRLAVPPADDVKTAKTKIAEIFKTDYETARRATGPEELGLLYKLAKDVIKLTEKDDDPATLYALFEVAIDIARESCHEALVLDFVQRFELKFNIDGLKKRADVLRVLRRELPLSIRNKVKVRAVANILRANSKVLFRQSLEREKWQVAKDLCMSYRGFCLLSGERQEATALKQALSLLEKKEAEAERFARYLRDGNENSKDPDKMLAIGTYLCFTKQQWLKGLTYIADGSDSKLAALAASDLTGKEIDHLSLGDRWWNLAMDDDYADYRLAILTRAKYFYWQALDKSTGLDKSKIEKRLIEANREIWGAGFFFDFLNNRVSPSTGMKFIQVRKGTFEMGEIQKNIDAFGKQASNYQHEAPRHPVSISKTFYLGQYEVTQEQWIKIMGTQPWTQDEIFGRESNFPVAFVSWNDAQEFCQRLSKLDKRKYRLPTEAEWELACRAGTSTRYYSGNPDSTIQAYEWVRDNAYDKMGWRSGTLVGTKLPNPFGFYDMLGNMYEWCEDTYESDYYSRSPKVDPINRAKGPWKVCRSGSIYGSSWTSRSASRQKAGPDERTRVISLRIAMEE